MDYRLRKALDHMDHGSYSLTVEGFGRRVFGRSISDREIIDLMRTAELPERRIQGPHGLVTVWDYDVQ